MTFFEAARDVFGLVNGLDFRFNQSKGWIEFSNGSIIFLMELKFYPSDPEFTDLGSLEITDAFVDEVPEITEKAWEILMSRIRYNLIGGVPKALACGNPQNNWVKHRFVSDAQDQPVTLKEYQRTILALLDDNPDEKFREAYRRNLERLNPYDRARLLYGDWTVRLNEQPFFPSFDRSMVKSGLVINYELPVWLSFDFNVKPTTCLIAQDYGDRIAVIQEVQVNGGTEVLCDAVLSILDYPPKGLKITGDYSGNTGSTAAGLLPGGVFNTDFEIIKRKFRVGPASLIDTRKANAKHSHSFRLCDQFLRHVPFEVDDSCKVLIRELSDAQLTEKGKLRKDRENFKMDAVDAFRYLISAIFGGSSKKVHRYAERLKWSHPG